MHKNINHKIIINSICKNKKKLVNQTVSVFVRKALLLALIIIATATHVLAHNSEPRDFIIMKTPYRHLIASPLPTTLGGDVDGEKIIVEASMATVPDTLKEDWNLSMAISAMQVGDDYAAEQYWMEFIESIKNNLIPIDINSVLLWTLRQSYLETNKDLSYFASKVKYFNDLKKTLRDELDEAERLWGEKECQATPPGTACSLNAVCCNMEGLISVLQNQLQTVGDDASLANIDLQNVLQQQQQTQLLLSNMAKVMYEATANIIQNIRGDDDDD